MEYRYLFLLHLCDNENSLPFYTVSFDSYDWAMNAKKRLEASNPNVKFTLEIIEQLAQEVA